MPKQWARRGEVLQNFEAEIHCLGAVLLDVRALDALVGIIGAEDFATPQHPPIWSAMVRLVGRQQPVTVASVGHELEQAGVAGHDWGLDLDGKPADATQYVLGLAVAVATAAGVEHHGRIVAECSAKRRLLAKLEESAQRLRETPTGEVGDFRNGLVADLLDDHREAPAQAVDVVEAGQRVYADLRDRHENPRPFVGIPSGLADLDALTLGFEDTDLITLAACSGHGKTLSGVWLAASGARLSGRHSLYVSVEVPAERISRRLMAADFGVDANRMRSGLLDANDWVNAERNVPKFAGLRGLMSVVHAAKCTVADVHTAIRRHQLRGGCPLGLVVVDYVQRLYPSERKRSREEEVADIARDLKTLAGMYRVPVIALAQLNRDLFKRADKRPVVSDLRESSAMEHESSVIILQHIPSKWDENAPKSVAELVIPKQRDGESGIVTVGISLAQQRLYNLERMYDGQKVGYDA